MKKAAKKESELTTEAPRRRSLFTPCREASQQLKTTLGLEKSREKDSYLSSRTILHEGPTSGTKTRRARLSLVATRHRRCSKREFAVSKKAKVQAFLPVCAISRTSNRSAWNCSRLGLCATNVHEAARDDAKTRQ